jgi:uncharacterized protein (TIGR02466 family)
VVDYQVINYHIDKVIDRVKFNSTDKWGKTHLISTDFSKKGFDDDNLIRDLKLKRLAKEIDYHLKEYCDEMKVPCLKYKMNSWFSKFESGSYAHIHNHGDSDISGVYYYKTNGEDGKFFFESPNDHLTTSKMYKNRGVRWEYVPKCGKIILFPGWLKHGVETNNTDNTRISVSFNIKFES